MNIQTTSLIAIGSIAIGASGAWWITREFEQAKCQSQISSIQTEYMSQLSKATAEAMAIERKYNAASMKAEGIYNEYQKKISETLSENRRLANKLGGLRDPGSRPCVPMPANANSSSVPTEQASGAYLSNEASEFLLDFAADADEAAAYASTCYEWIRSLSADHPMD